MNITRDVRLTCATADDALRTDHWELYTLDLSGVFPHITLGACGRN